MQRKKQGKGKRTALNKVAVKGKTLSSVELSFRPRTADDDQYIVDLTEAQLGSIHQRSFGEPFPRQQFLSYIQSGAPTYVVLQNGTRIGYYSYLIGPDNKMHVTALVLEQSQQSVGLGTEVMEQLEREAKDKGVHTLEVFVQESNAKSLAFTRKLGFIEAFRPMPNTIGFQKRIQSPTDRTFSDAAVSETMQVGYFSYQW